MTSMLLAGIAAFLATQAGTGVVTFLLGRFGVSAVTAKLIAPHLVPIIRRVLEKAEKGEPLTDEEKTALADNKRNMPIFFGTGSQH